MYKSLIIFSFLFLTTETFASLEKCGIYEVNGIIKKIKEHRVLVVNENTQSEHQIYFDEQNQAQLAVYDDKDVNAEVILVTAFNGTVGNAQSLKKIKSRIPEYLKPNDTGFKLISALDCKKN